jgi:hypothetical protein
VIKVKGNLAGFINVFMQGCRVFAFIKPQIALGAGSLV